MSDKNGTLMRALWNGKCSVCGTKITVGDMILYADKKATHRKCAPMDEVKKARRK